MTKSLYVRVVLTFLGAVLISLLLSLLLIVRLFEDRIRLHIQDEMIATGKEIIESYVEAYPDHAELVAKGIAVSASNAVNFFGPDGRLRHADVLSPDKRISLPPSAVDYVLAGGVYRNSDPKGHRSLVVGLPFQIGHDRFAVFIAPDLGPFLKLIVGFFQFELLIVLIFGSVFILIAAQFIVRPLKRLTLATRRMSKGDFRVELRSKRRDEIGQLTRSFDAMAKELGALEQIRQRFVSNVSHEIQSPLTSIKGFTQALKHKKLDEAGRLRLLTIIEEETDRLSRLGEDLLQLSSLEYEHLELNRRVYRLDEQLRKVVIAQEPLWSQRSLHMELELDEIEIEADEDKLYRLWINLINNAIKFSSPGGEVGIRARLEGDAAIVVVRDEGAGIAEEELEAIFRPFYKTDPSRTRSVPGNGIGLSIAKRIVDLHGGDIQAASRPGEGTAFQVRLPAGRSRVQL